MKYRDKKISFSEREFISYTGLLFVFVLLFTSGCVVMSSSVDTGNLLVEENVGKIQKGKTTRGELLKLLGPPTAALYEGEQTTIPTSSGEEKLTYKLAFLPFADKFESRPDYVIFYYQNASASHSGVMVVAAAKSTIKIERNRLWVLLDENQDFVADYVFRND